MQHTKSYVLAALLGLTSAEFTRLEGWAITIDEVDDCYLTDTLNTSDYCTNTDGSLPNHELLYEGSIITSYDDAETACAAIEGCDVAEGEMVWPSKCYTDES